MNRKTNPGNHVMTVGLFMLLAFVCGVAFTYDTPPGKQPTFALIVAGVIFVLTIFIASVVGAYYAGKGKR